MILFVLFFVVIMNKKMMYQGLKQLVYGGLLCAALYVGDKYTPLTHAFENNKFEGIVAEKGTPKDYLNWNTKIEVNDQGHAVLYLGNKLTGVYKTIDENGYVGTLQERFYEFFSEKKTDLQNWYHKSF